MKNTEQAQSQTSSTAISHAPLPKGESRSFQYERDRDRLTEPPAIKDSERLVMFVNGACANNGSRNTATVQMATAVVNECGNLLTYDRAPNAGGTNNVAELAAILAGVHYATRKKYTSVEIITNSTTALAWADGRFGAKLKERNGVSIIYEQLCMLSRSINVKLTLMPSAGNLAVHYVEYVLH